MAVHPIDKVCEWIGNTPLIAMKHYKQQRDEDFIQVARLATDAERGPGQSLAMALQSGSDGEGQDGSGELASVGAASENYESSAISGPAVESGRATVYDNAAVWQRFCLPAGPPLRTRPQYAIRRHAPADDCHSCRERPGRGV